MRINQLKLYSKYPLQFLILVKNFIISSFKNPKDEFQFIKYDKSFFYGNPVKGNVAKIIFKTGYTEFLTTERFKRFLKPHSIVIDIGANHGYYSFIAASRIGHEGKVYAVDPMKKSLEKLIVAQKVNKYNNIEICNIALSDKESKLKVHNKSLQVSSEGESVTIVQAYTFDQYFQFLEKLDLIKMDIEGHEFNCLLGMENSLRRFKPVIFIEIHPKFLMKNGVNVHDIFKYLSKFGYKIEGIDINSKEMYNILTSNSGRNFHIIAI